MAKLKGALPADFLKNRKLLDVKAQDQAEARCKLASLAVNPESTAARLVLDFTPGYGLELARVSGELADIGAAVGRGDLSHMERMLSAQALALNAIFVNLAERAGKCVTIDPYGSLLGLALRAQNQCRATIETLAEVKFPKSATFIRQANIAEQQQINNGLPSRAREPEPISSTELLEAKPYEVLRLDPGATGTAGQIDPLLETVGAVHRADKF